MRQAQRRSRLRVRAGADDPAEKMQILSVFIMVLALGLIIVLALVHTHVRYNDVRFQRRALEKAGAGLLETLDNLQPVYSWVVATAACMAFSWKAARRASVT